MKGTSRLAVRQLDNLVGNPAGPAELSTAPVGEGGGKDLKGRPSSLQMVPYTAMVVVRFMLLPVLKPQTGLGRVDDQPHAAPLCTRAMQ